VLVELHACSARNLRKRQIHVADGLINLLRALKANRRAVHPCILESEPHRLHTVVMAMLELTAATQLHPDHTQPFILQLVDVIDHFAHVVGVVGVLVGRPVHACAIVVDADQSHVEPIGTRHLAQSRQPMH
jgi:hypothetical protein